VGSVTAAPGARHASSVVARQVAVADGSVDFAMGSDTGGARRTRAHGCMRRLAASNWVWRLRREGQADRALSQAAASAARPEAALLSS